MRNTELEQALALLPYMASLAISLGIGLYAWQRRRASGVTLFALYAFGQALWTLGYIFELLASDLGGKLFWDCSQYVGGLIAFVCLIPFVLQFTGHPLGRSRRLIVTLIASAAVVSLLVLTNPLTHWLQGADATILPVVPFGALVYSFTPAAYAITAYGYLLYLVALVLLTRQLFHAKGIARVQFAAVLSGFLLYGVGNLAIFFGVTLSGQRDISPLSSAVSNLIIAWGVFRYHLFDIIPIAREVVVEHMSSAVIVLDLEDRIIDVNPAARRLMTDPPKALFGQSLDAVLPVCGDFMRRDSGSTPPGSHSILKLAAAGADIYVEVSLSNLTDHRHLLVGRLLTLSDVTERVRAQNAIAALTAETERLYQISREINGAQTFPGIIDAIARKMDDPSYGLGLLLYENNDRQDARQFSIVARRSPFDAEASSSDEQFDAANVAQWMDQDIFAVEDTHTDPRLSSSVVDYFRRTNVRALVVTRLVRGDRILGALILTSPRVEPFSEHDRRFLQSVSDLTVTAIERTRLYEDQVRVAQELQHVDQIKSQFLASMSHELRTPLNAVLNFTDFVANGIYGPVNAQQVDALQKASSSGRHLLSVINDVLDVAKIQAGKIDLLIERDCDLLPELNAAAAAVQPALEGKPVRFFTDIDAELPRVSIDRRRVRQILLNLLSNAAKFTAKGSITLSAKTTDQGILIAVMDTGPGISAKDQKIIFEPFRQTEIGLNASSGTGLGLFISRQLAEAHGGTLRVESEPGQGAAFFLTLPLAAAIPPSVQS